MSFQLYEDQQEFISKLRESLKGGVKSVLGVASPAFGKTVIAAHITQQARNRDPNASVWFLVHRKNLLRQTSKSFWQAKIEHGLITSGKMRSTLPIQVGTIGTVHSRMESLQPPKILFIDEAHLSKGNMFQAVISWARQSGAIVIGLTGTPVRLDGKSLGDLYEVIIEAKSTKWLIEQGRLSEYVAYTTPVNPDLSSVKTMAGDYNIGDLAAAMDKPTIVGDAVAHYQRLASGKRAVVYCCNVAHSKHTAEAFNASGIPAAHVDASTTEAELKEICEALADRRVLVLVNCELVIEGFDLSAQVGRDVTLECCILLRPTQSVARYLQMVFRALRRKPEPANILDHAGCIIKHGLPCEQREWSLLGKPKGKRKTSDEPDVNIQQCKHCYAVFIPGPDTCPHCGKPIEKKVRKIQQSDGELEQIDIAAVRKEQRKEQGSARTLQDLVALGMRRGMAKASQWAAITAAARAGRKPTAADFNEARRIQQELTR
jgi:superfamily II DNA or RNA helicase